MQITPPTQFMFYLSLLIIFGAIGVAINLVDCGVMIALEQTCLDARAGLAEYWLAFVILMVFIGFLAFGAFVDTY